MAVTTPIKRQVRLSARPAGLPQDTDFELVETPVPSPGAGEMLCRTVYLSLDPYMRGRMNAGASYAKGVDLGEVMGAGTVSQVVESKLDGFDEDDFVLTHNGWQDYAVSGPTLPTGQAVRKLDPGQAPVSTAVGVLGMPGHTAYVGLLDHGRPQPGETVVVSAASGAVGAVVGQLARIKGCRVVGVAGAQEKCDYVVDELGFDACVSHRSDTLPADLKAGETYYVHLWMLYRWHGLRKPELAPASTKTKDGKTTLKRIKKGLRGGTFTRDRQLGSDELESKREAMASTTTP